MELTETLLQTLREGAQAAKDAAIMGTEGAVIIPSDILLALVEKTERFMAEGAAEINSGSGGHLIPIGGAPVPFVSEELVPAKGTEGTPGRGQTHHYERRDDGFYIVWGADFGGEDSSCRWLGASPQADWLTALDPVTQDTYMDLRTRVPSAVGVNEMGRCRRCDEYVPPSNPSGPGFVISISGWVVETEEPHICNNLIEEE